MSKVRSPFGDLSPTNGTTPLLNPKSRQLYGDMDYIIDVGEEKETEGTNNLAENHDHDCALVVSSLEPRLDNLSEILIGNAGYIRFGNKVYYGNRRLGQCIPLQTETAINKNRLSRFDSELQVFAHPETALFSGAELKKKLYRVLSEEELNKVLLLLGHRHPRPIPAPAPASAWQQKNGCDLLLVDKPPSKDALKTLGIINAGYLRYRNELWYANVKKNELILLNKIKGKKLERFDYAMQTTSSHHRHLSDKDLERIKTLTGHLHRTRWQKFLAGFGHFCSAFIAVGCGVSTAAAFISLNVATGGLAGVGAALLFIGGTTVNWWIFKRYVSTVLIDLFGREKFLIDEEGEQLKWDKKIYMGIAMALSLSVGITFGALTYASTFTLSTAFPILAAIAPAFPPIAAVLAGVTLICMTALMIKDISELIKKKDIKGECIKFLKNLVSTDPELPQNKGKSTNRIKFERIATVFLTAVFLPLACLGLFMTMNACVPGVKAILLDKIPGMSAAAANVIASVVSLGLAFLGQIPFGIQVAFQTIAKIFSPKVKEEVNTKPESTAAKAWKGFKLFNVAINAIGNGLIAMMGAAKAVSRALALLSGTGNSAFAGVPAVLGAKPTPIKLPERSTQDESSNLNHKKAAPFVAHDTSPLLPRVKKLAVGNNTSALFHHQDNELKVLRKNAGLEKNASRRTVDDMPVRYVKYSGA